MCDGFSVNTRVSAISRLEKPTFKILYKHTLTEKDFKAGFIAWNEHIYVWKDWKNHNNILMANSYKNIFHHPSNIWSELKHKFSVLIFAKFSLSSSSCSLSEFIPRIKCEILNNKLKTKFS